LFFCTTALIFIFISSFFFTQKRVYNVYPGGFAPWVYEIKTAKENGEIAFTDVDRVKLIMTLYTKGAEIMRGKPSRTPEKEKGRGEKLCDIIRLIDPSFITPTMVKWDYPKQIFDANVSRFNTVQ